MSDPTSTQSSEAFEVRNPATGELIQTVPITSPQELTEMVARARGAQPEWDRMGFKARGAIMLRARKWLLDNSERVVATVVSETGKTYEDALLAEVAYIANALGFWTKHGPKYLGDEVSHSTQPFLLGRKLISRYKPCGVVGVIGPWNYPLTNCFGDCIPALIAGNTVVLKPSRVTPLSSLLMAEMMRKCGLPDYVFTVAPGGAATAEALIDAADMIMFTGSTATGKLVAKRAAETLTPVGLELGGKDPMIVLADADIERAANAAVFYSMHNTGQTCISVERVYVEAPVYDEFVARVEKIAGGLRQGVPSGPGSVEVGSLTVESQAKIVSDHVDQAVSSGAKRLIGDGVRSGNFYPPTVLVDVDHSMTCMTEETFGPLLPIMRVESEKEAIELANDSQYGLSASIFTKDLARAERIAGELEVGAVGINDAETYYMALDLPMGGWKTSGLGVRHGAPGIRKYCRHQSVMVNRFARKRDPHMFPFTERKTRSLLSGLKLLYGRGRGSGGSRK